MERRQFKRLPAEAEVQIQTVDAKEQEQEQAMSSDLSGGGILLTTQQAYAPGSLLDLQVRSAIHQNFSHAFKPLHARVRVLRCDGDEPPYQIAAEFIEVN